MKPFCKVVLPRVAGALLAVYAAWMFCTHFGLIPVLTSYLPYLILALVLFKGNRDTPLAVVVVLVFLARLWVTNITMHLSNALPNWGYVLYPYLIGELLLTAFVLVNTVTKLKKFRLWVNYLWFLPGAAMLACPVAGFQRGGRSAHLRGDGQHHHAGGAGGQAAGAGTETPCGEVTGKIYKKGEKPAIPLLT